MFDSRFQELWWRSLEKKAHLHGEVTERRKQEAWFCVPIVDLYQNAGRDFRAGPDARALNEREFSLAENDLSSKTHSANKISRSLWESNQETWWSFSVVDGFPTS